MQNEPRNSRAPTPGSPTPGLSSPAPASPDKHAPAPQSGEPAGGAPAGEDGPASPAWAKDLRQLYDAVVEEPLPDSIIDLLSQLDADD